MTTSDKQPRQYVDDKSILNETLIYRRVPNRTDPQAAQIVWHDDDKCWKPSTAAFRDSSDGSAMSVGLGDTLQELGLPPESILANYPHCSLICFPAGAARAKSLGVVRDPLPQDPAHGEVFGDKTKPVQRHLIANSTWHVAPNLPPPSNQ